MIRIVLGSVIGGLAMFVVGFIFWATPLAQIGYSHAGDAQSAAVQTALAQNLTASGTGRYIVPDPSTAGGTTLFGRGPVATVSFNTGGFSTGDSGPMMIAGFVQEVIVTLMMALALWPVLTRVPDFESRARVVVGLSAAASVMIELSVPIFEHGPWRYAIYATVADIAMLSAAGLVLARWFLPHAGVRQPVA